MGHHIEGHVIHCSKLALEVIGFFEVGQIFVEDAHGMGRHMEQHMLKSSFADDH